MFPPVDTRNPAAVRAECERHWQRLPVAPESGRLSAVFDWVQEAFRGRDPGFEPLDTPYHDHEHTLQVTLCLTRLIAGWHGANVEPQPDSRAIRLGTIAALLHDTGYLKDRGDTSGTGAKLTSIHVHRSMLFAERLLTPHQFLAPDIHAIQSMIGCTAVDANPRPEKFEGLLQLQMGCALGTADLLGQMAADNYLEKLTFLHAEFAEAAQATPETHPAPPATAAELIRRTPRFWRESVRPSLEREYRGIYRFLNAPWPDGPNEYILRIEQTLARIPVGKC